MRSSILLLPLLLIACGQPPDAGAPPEPGPEPDAGVGPELDGYYPDATPEGAALFVRAVPAGAGLWSVSVHAAALGPVFGVGGHLQFDAERWTLEGEATLDVSVLGGEDGAAAMPFNRVLQPGELAFGAVRLERTLGDLPIVAPTRLFSAVLRSTQPGEGRLELTRVLVRRSDGAYVPVATTGGRLLVNGARS